MLRSAPKEIHFADRVFSKTLKAFALSVPLLLGFIALFLWIRAFPAFHQFGFSFLRTSTWDPVRSLFGAFPVIFGTLLSSFLAIALAAPLSVGVALFVNEVAPPAVAAAVGFLVQMLAAIPSVVYGLWGIFVLAPWLRQTVEPFLARYLGFIPLFRGPAYGVGMLAGGMILAIMVTPTISSICREVFKTVPSSNKEAAIALGSTRWEMIRIAVIDSSKSGILGAVILGLGRALGETMAVTMVIGNRAEIAASLFAPGQTMASVIANEYAEATSDLHLSALAAIGFSLFGLTLLLNAIAHALVWKVARNRVTP